MTTAKNPSALADLRAGLRSTQAAGWLGYISYLVTEADGNMTKAEVALGVPVGTFDALQDDPGFGHMVLVAIVKGLRDAAEESRRIGRK